MQLRILHQIPKHLNLICNILNPNLVLEFEFPKMMNQSQDASFQAGQAKAQTEEKAGTMMNQAGNAVQSAKESCQETGQQMREKAQGAADAVKNATGMNK